MGTQARAAAATHRVWIGVYELLESFRSEQQESGTQKSCERGFSFPEDGCQGQEWLELGSGMKRAISALPQGGEISWVPQSTRFSWLRES